MRIGVYVGPIGQVIKTGLGTTSTSPELKPTIENTTLYVNFLSNLQPSDFEKPGDRRLAEDVMATLSFITEACYNRDKQKDFSDDEKEMLAIAGEDCLRTFMAIEPHYIRLGLDDKTLKNIIENSSRYTSETFAEESAMRAFGSMQDRIYYWGRNLLPEFITAENGQYLKAPSDQEFGPSQWHTDGGQSRWSGALEFVDGLKHDKRTQEFAKEITANLIESIDTALAKMDEGETDKYVLSQRSDLENLRNALAGQPYDAAQLEKYTKS